ncbi:MAG: hypothetical protein ACF8XB_20975 [Planctomycetota bacterium JB042]
MKNLTLIGWLACAPAALAGDNDYYLSVPAQGAIMRVDGSTGQSSVFSPGLKIPHYGVWLNNADTGHQDLLFEPDRYWPAIFQIDADGNSTALSAGGLFDKPVTIIEEPNGQGLVVSDGGNDRIILVKWDGSQVLLHDNSTANGLLGSPDGMAYDRDGNLYVANLTGDTITKIAPDGTATLFSDSSLIDHPGGMAIDGSGNMFVNMYGGSKLVRFRLDTAEATVFAEDAVKMDAPSDLKLSRYGGLIASTRNSNILKIDALGNIEVFFHDASYGDIVGIAQKGDGDKCTGTFESYGQGLAGSGGHVPRLSAIYSPCMGMPIALEMDRYLGGAPTLLIVGFGATSFPWMGGELLIDFNLPAFFANFTMPGSGPGNGALRLPAVVPDDNPNLVGLEIFMQTVTGDPGAVQGLSLSNGLHETIGS